MKGFAWRCLLVVSLPACALIQPLDEATPDSAGGSSAIAGTGNKGPSGGSAGASTTGGTNSTSGGSGNVTGGSGGVPSGGVPSGGSGGRPSGGSGAAPPGGSGGGPSGKNLTLFVGSWFAVDGTDNYVCDGTPGSNDLTGATETWSLGTTSDLVMDNTVCTYEANVTGREATDVPGQQCTIEGTDSTTNDPLEEVDSIVSYSFDVTADGTDATETVTGTAIVTDTVTGSSYTCTFNDTADYVKQ